jgi:chemotaxis protein CheZ
MHDAPPVTLPARDPLQKLSERMRHHHARSTGPDPVIVEEIVTAVLDTMCGRLSPLEDRLLREIGGLGRIIEEAKAGIAEVSFDAIRGNHIPSATDELGAVVEHTAIATNIIMDSCEALDRLAGELGPARAAVLQDATARIYEACSFQDITGQRITKVVKALQAIEAKVLALAGTCAPPDAPPRPDPARTAEGPADVLLNGPMLPHEAMCQDDIDKLLADFG